MQINSIMDEIMETSVEDIPTPEDMDNECNNKGNVLDSSFSSESNKIEGQKLTKPVLGKLQAKKRLMAFANKYSAMPKVKKTKIKEGKAKRESDH